MANRYWVGGTAAWDATAGTKWATTSGGPGGAAVPTSADDVYFDGFSSGATVTVSGTTRSCRTLTFSGFTGTFAGTVGIDIYGSLFAAPTFTRTYTGAIRFAATSGSWSIGSTGLDWASAVTFGVTASTATWALAGDVTFSSTGTTATTLTYGTLNLGSYRLKTATFSSSNSNTRTLAFGTGVLDLASTTSGTTILTMSTVTRLTVTSTSGEIQVTGAGNMARTITAATTVNLPTLRVLAGTGGSVVTTGSYLDIDCATGSAFTGQMQANCTVRRSMYLRSGMASSSFAGTTVFSSSSAGNVFDTAGVTYSPNIQFTGGGEWALTNGLSQTTTGRSLTVISGTLNLAGSAVTTSRFLATTGAVNINFQGSTLTINNNSSPQLRITNASSVCDGTGAIVIDTPSYSSLVEGTAGLLLPALTVRSAGANATTLTNINCASYTQTAAYSGVMTASTPLTIRGSLSLNAGNNTPNLTGCTLTFSGGSGAATIDTAGKTLNPSSIVLSDADTSWMLASHFTTTAPVEIDAGSLSTGVYNLTAASFDALGATVRTLDFGSGTHTFTALAGYQVSNTNTISAASANFVLSDNNAAFSGGDATYGSLSFTSTLAGTRSVNGTNVFGSFSAATPAAATSYTLSFEAGSTQYIGAWSVDGASAGRTVTITSSTPAYHYLVATASGFTSDYVEISYSRASPDANWRAGVNAIDSGNNDGWFDIIATAHSSAVAMAITGVKTVSLGLAESRNVAHSQGKTKALNVAQAIQEELALGELGRSKVRELATALVQDSVVVIAPEKRLAVSMAQEGDYTDLISPLVLKKHGIARCVIDHIYELLCQDEDSGDVSLSPATSPSVANTTFLSYRLGKLDELPGDGIDRRLQVEYIGIDKWHTLANLHTFGLLIRVGYFHGEDLESTMGRVASDEHIICTALGFRDNWTASCLTDGTLYGYTLKPSTITYLDNERLVLEIALDVQVG